MLTGSYRNNTKLYPSIQDNLLIRMNYSTPNLPAYILSLPQEDQYNLLRGMVKTIEKIIQTAYIKPQSHLLPLSNEETKGYVPYSDIFKQGQFRAYLQSVDLRPFSQEEHEAMCELLMLSIKKASRILWANPGGVRLLSMHGIDKIFPVCFENYDQSNNCHNFQNLLAQFCSITNIEYNKEEGWAIVYTNQPEKLLQLDQYKWYDVEHDQECQMRVITQQCLERAKESFLEISAYMKHSEMYRATITEVMPCVRTLKSVKVRNGDTIKNAIVEELVSFGTPKQHYESCCVQNDDTFLVTFPSGSRIAQEKEQICQEEQNSF